VTHLEILEEIQGLGHCNVTIGLEHHHGQWATWKHISDDELSDDVKTKLPVGDSLDHTDWDEENDWDQHADDESPPGHVSVVVKTDEQGQGEENDVENKVPPFWGITVLAHHLEMDIGILVTSELVTGPDLLTVVKSSVDDESGDGCERDTVTDGEVGGEEKR
jgi:cobalamin-dependent methionine synthase I